jgi:K+/H+ antiporter YhaU regulatory subunit KhtT
LIISLSPGEGDLDRRINIRTGCSLIGKTVVEAELRRRTWVTLVAIYRAQNSTNIIPDTETIFEEGDKIIILGSREQLE